MVHKKKKTNNVYKIFSRGIDRKTGKILAYRTEFVDVNKNELFKDYPSNEKTVKAVYEAFWNISPKEEKVIVDKVVKSTVKSKGKNWGIKLLT